MPVPGDVVLGRLLFGEGSLECVTGRHEEIRGAGSGEGEGEVDRLLCESRSLFGRFAGRQMYLLDRS